MVCLPDKDLMLKCAISLSQGLILPWQWDRFCALDLSSLTTCHFFVNSICQFKKNCMWPDTANSFPKMSHEGFAGALYWFVLTLLQNKTYSAFLNSQWFNKNATEKTFSCDFHKLHVFYHWHQKRTLLQRNNLQKENLVLYEI